MFNRKKIEKLEDKLASQMLENVMLSIKSGFFQNRLKDTRSKLTKTELELDKVKQENVKLKKGGQEMSKGVDYIGKIDLLHRHPEMEGRMGLDPDHVIVDRKDWDLVIAMFEAHNHNVKPE